MADPPSFADLQTSLKSALITTTRTTSALCAEDLPFARSLDADFARQLDTQNARLLALAERLLASAVGGDAQVVSAANRVGAPKLQDGDALDRNWTSVVDVVDSLLERTDGLLDEVRGVIKKGTTAAQHAVTSEAEKPAATPKIKKSFQQAANILKPQRAFACPPENFATGPWKPLLTRKPHAKVPLEQSLRTEASTDGTARQIYRHPYQTEIEDYKYSPSMYIKQDPIPYQPYEDTAATLVDTEEAMEEMLEELKKAKEIAIDLEHHDQRTYIGVVCLMQISTRDRDWIVDTLKPWRRRLECLNEVFADPSILKVLHGSSMDIIWLQRDLGLYLVGVFDTEHAAVALHYPKRGLAYLLEKHVNFQAQKQHQLADWRVRPLPKELFDYARSDTHFLLYIYDCMRNELIENSALDQPDGDLITRVLQETKRYQLQRYEHPFYDAENGLGPVGWYKQLFRTPALLSKQQFSVFKAVHQWRDNMARQEDESLLHVMSNHLLQTIAREMPTTPANLLAATPAYANLVRNNAEQLIAVIVDAKERGANGPEMRDAMAKSDQLADEQHNNRIAARDAVAAAIKAKLAALETAEPVPAITPSNTTRRPTIAVNLNSVKAGGSAFWGSTLGSSTQQRQMSSDVRLALPMPEVSEGVFAANGVTPAKNEVPLVAPLTPATPVQDEAASAVVLPGPNAEVSDVFVLRERGGRKSKKRKAGEGAETETIKDELRAGADEVDITGTSELGNSLTRPTKEKKQKKRKSLDTAQTQVQDPKNDFLTALNSPAPTSTLATKTKKKKKKGKKEKPADTTRGFMAALMRGSDTAAEAKDQEEPFDYANAPSLLNATPPADESAEKKKKVKKGKMDGFDPYKKALDTKKGVPRGQKERVGMTGTFKS